MYGSTIIIHQLGAKVQRVSSADMLFPSDASESSWATTQLFHQLARLAQRLQTGQTSTANGDDSAALAAARGLLRCIERQYYAPQYAGHEDVRSMREVLAGSPHRSAFRLNMALRRHFCLWHGACSHPTMKCRLLRNSTIQRLVCSMLCHPQGCITYMKQQRKRQEVVAAKRNSSATAAAAAPVAKRQAREPVAGATAPASSTVDPVIWPGEPSTPTATQCLIGCAEC